MKNMIIKPTAFQDLFGLKVHGNLPEKLGDIEQLIKLDALDTIMVLDLKRQNIGSIQPIAHLNVPELTTLILRNDKH